MKKALIILVFSILFVFSAITARAESYPAEPIETEVEFDGNRLSDNYDEQAVAQALSGMQPGDDAILEFVITNNSDKNTDWYMDNNVLKSFEDFSEASGGAYFYHVSYISASGTTNRDLYYNEALGGDNGDLKKINESLGTYFFLETLKPGQSARVLLYIRIDGETHRNEYQNTNARIQLHFAVEVEGDVFVDTGDHGHLAGYIVIETVSLIGLITLFWYQKRRQEVQ